MIKYNWLVDVVVERSQANSTSHTVGYKVNKICSFLWK